MDNVTLKRFLVSIAQSIPDDEAAYSILDEGLINGFHIYYNGLMNEIKEQNIDGNVLVLPALIKYIQQTMRDDNSAAMMMSLKNLDDPKTQIEIVSRVLNDSETDLFTALAQRPTCKERIKSILKSNDRMNMYSQIESTRFDLVFDMFIDTFREHSASNFGWGGSFIAYVESSFTKFFYNSRTIDIWKTLRRPDAEKRELETKTYDAVESTRVKTDDTVIQPLAVNIIVASKELFFNAGQYEYSHGTKYDLYYMVMLMLCQNYIDEINKKLEKYYGANAGYRVELVDERDYEKDRPGMPAVSGIASRIKNAKDVVSLILKQVASSNISFDNIMSLRDSCFARGKNGSEHPVWDAIGSGGEAKRYIDLTDGLVFSNYSKFDIILKGVLSTYTLMKELEEHGRFIVDTYDSCPDLFFDTRLPRSIDRISSLDKLDLILRYQTDNCPQMIKGARGYLTKDTDEGGELLTFDGMLNDYAGSPDSLHGLAPERRRNAEIKGFTDNISRKKSGRFQTLFSQLVSVHNVFSSIPTSYMDFLSTKGSVMMQDFFDPLVELAANDIVPGKYNSLYSNYFFINNPEMAKYYLFSLNSRPKNGEPANSILDLSWNLGEGMTPCEIIYDRNSNERRIAMYIPMVDEYAVFKEPKGDTWDENVRLMGKHEIINEFIKEENNVGHDNILMTESCRIPSVVYRKTIDDKAAEQSIETALNQSISFNPVIGFSNLSSSVVLDMVDSIEVFAKYKKPVRHYIQWLSDLSVLQNSFMEVFRMMLSYGVYCTRSRKTAATPDRYNGVTLVRSLLSSEFNHDNLDWFFGKLLDTMSKRQLVEPNTVYGVPYANAYALEVKPIDTSCISIILGDFENTSLTSDMLSDIKEQLNGVTEVSDRFIYLYNYVCSRVTFLQILKDAFSIIFLNQKASISTLCCELNSRCKIEHALMEIRNGRQTDVVKGVKYASIDSVVNDDLLRFLSDISVSNYETFSTICDDLLAYINQCKNDISSLMNYEVSGHDNIEQRFRECGSMFFLTGIINDPAVNDVLQKILEVTTPDSTGFLTSKGRYFTSTSGKETYYIHSTGRIAVINGDKVEPIKFDLSVERDKERYISILQKGA